MRLAAALILMTLSSATPLPAQDLVAIAPQAAHVEFENAQVRVVRLKLAPHESLPIHDRPARVVIPLTVNDVTLTTPDGHTRTVRADAGKAAWSEPGKRSVQNLSTPLENIVVELKTARELAKSLAHAPDPRPAEYLVDPYHHWQFENQYVRVFDVRIPPGATTDYHLHALDTVVIYVSGGRVATQLQGDVWKAATNDAPGSIEFAADAAKPRTHRVHNEGNTEFHVILVQFLK